MTGWWAGWKHASRPTSGSAIDPATLSKTVGHIDTLLFANRSLLDTAAEGHTPASHAAQLKYLVTGNAIRAVELAIEASGNPGLSRNNPLQRHYRDVLCSRVHTPQNDVVLQGVGKAVFAERQQEEHL